MSDEELWHAARHRLSKEKTTQLEALSSKQQEHGLTSREKGLPEQLVEF